MSDYYWVGGNGTWDSVTTSVWSVGGSTPATPPTSSDNVFFNQAGTFTVTVSSGAVCANLTVSATTYTFQTTAIQVFGNLTLVSGTVWNIFYYFGGTGSYTLTTNGVSGSQLFCTTGATITLGSALTLSGSIVNFSGGSTLNTAGYQLTCGVLGAFTSGGSRTFNFSNSAITITSSGSGNNWRDATITSTSGATITFTTTGILSLITLGVNNYIPALRFTGASGNSVTINGNGATVQDISCTYVGAKTFRFTAGVTITFVAFNLRGTSGNLYTITSTTTSPATLTKAGNWYMGANSLGATGSGNTGLTFTDGSGIDYLNVSNITGTTTNATPGNFFSLVSD